MKIEEAIKQSSFTDDKSKMVVNVIYTSGWLTYQHGSVFKTLDLSMQQYNVLRILKGQLPEAATVNMIIDRMLDKSSNASRIVEKLRSKGLVARKACPSDRRRVDVKITESGQQMLMKATAMMEDQSSWIFDNLDDIEAKELNRLLDKLRTNTKHN